MLSPEPLCCIKEDAMLSCIKECLQMLGKLLTMSVPKEKSVLAQRNYSSYLKKQKKPKKSILAEKVEFLNEKEDRK